MSGATKYTIAVQEPVAERKFLTAMKYNLAVAQVVKSGGAPMCNTIFQSHFLGPSMTVTWQAVYGLNFQTNVPTPGVQVEVEGDWQACALGESFILDNTGTWANNPSSSTAQGDALNVVNNYQMVSIVVGTQDPTTFEWQPIFFSDSQLPIDGTGAYAPIENIQIWYGENQSTGSVIATQATSVGPWVMSQGNPHYFRWNLNGTWSDRSTPFAPALSLRAGKHSGKRITNGINGTNGTKLSFQDPIIKTCTFTIGVTKIDGFIRDFKAHMNSQGWLVAVTVQSGTVYSIAGSRNSLQAVAGADLTSSITVAIKACIRDGTLPANEGWDIV